MSGYLLETVQWEDSHATVTSKSPGAAPCWAQQEWYFSLTSFQ